MTKSNYRDYREFISKPEVSFWMPIITSALLIATSWFALSTKVELLNQKVDNLTSLVEKLSIKYSNVEDRYGTTALRIQRIETTLHLGPIQ